MSTNQPSPSSYAVQQPGKNEGNKGSAGNWQQPDAFRKSPLVWIGLLLALVLVLGGGIGVFLKLNQGSTTAPQSTIVGHAFFVSSGQTGIGSNAGIADQLQISLQNIQPPLAGKSYYAWLLSDSNIQALPILLGTLPVQNGQATLTYAGDSHHTDILASYSRFLVTEEDASTPPVNYTLDKSAWIFGAAFSDVANPKDTTEHFSLLNHLRHLLAQDPKLKTAGLCGRIGHMAL